MTSVRVVKSDLTGYKSFESSGHSGYAEEGSDIVCAAISSVTELVISILERFSVDFTLDIREDTTQVLCKIAQNDVNSSKVEIITNVVGGYADYLSEVACEYPKYLKCILTEK